MSLGVHVSKTSKVLENAERKTMLDALKEDCEELKLTAAQIYTHGPYNSRKNKMDYSAIKKYCTKNTIDLYVHSSYVTAPIWNLTEVTRDLPKIKNYTARLEDQLKSCELLDAKGLVLHFPKTKPLNEVLETVNCSMFKILANRYAVPILFEMVPVKEQGRVRNTKGKIVKEQGYVTAEQINKFCSAVRLPKSQWGIVMDTSHLWGSGINTNDKQTQDEWFNSLSHPDMVKLVHLNGSENKTFNSGRDVHIIAFSGHDDMYKKYADDHDSKKCDMDLLKNSGVYTIVRFVMKKNISIICEINRGSEKDVRRSLKLINRLAKTV